MDAEIGQTFERLTVERRVKSLGGGRRFHCSCSCGGHREARISDLRRGSIKSCGCLRREAQKAIGKRRGRVQAKSSSSRARQLHSFELSQEPRGYWVGAIEWARRSWR